MQNLFLKLNRMKKETQCYEIITELLNKIKQSALRIIYIYCLIIFMTILTVCSHNLLLS